MKDKEIIKFVVLFFIFFCPIVFLFPQSIQINYTPDGKIETKVLSSYVLDTLEYNGESYCLGDYVSIQMSYHGESELSVINEDTTSVFSQFVNSFDDSLITVVTHYPYGCIDTRTVILDIDDNCSCQIDSIEIVDAACDFFDYTLRKEQRIKVYTQGYDEEFPRLLINDDTIILRNNNGVMDGYFDLVDVNDYSLDLDIKFLLRPNCTYDTIIQLPNCGCLINSVEIEEFIGCNYRGESVYKMSIDAENEDYFIINGVWDSDYDGDGFYEAPILDNGALHIYSSDDSTCQLIDTIIQDITNPCSCDILSAELIGFSHCDYLGESIYDIKINAVNEEWFILNGKFGSNIDGDSIYKATISSNGLLSIRSSTDNTCSLDTVFSNLSPQCQCSINDVSFLDFVPVSGPPYSDRLISINTSNTTSNLLLINGQALSPVEGDTVYSVPLNSDGTLDDLYIQDFYNTSCNSYFIDGLINNDPCTIDSVLILSVDTCLDGTLPLAQLLVYSNNNPTGDYVINNGEIESTLIGRSAIADTIAIEVGTHGEYITLELRSSNFEYCSFSLSNPIISPICECEINSSYISNISECVMDSFNARLYLSSSYPPKDLDISVNGKLYKSKSYYTGYSFHRRDYDLSFDSEVLSDMEIHFIDDVNCRTIEDVNFLNPCIDNRRASDSCHNAIEIDLQLVCNEEVFIWTDVSPGTENLSGIQYENDNDDVWFKFEIDHTDTVIITINGDIDGFPPAFVEFSLYMGSSCSDLQLLSNLNSCVSSKAFVLNPGVHYVRTSSWSFRPEFGFSICLLPISSLRNQINVAAGNQSQCNNVSNRYEQDIVITNNSGVQISYNSRMSFLDDIFCSQNEIDTLKFNLNATGQIYQGDDTVYVWHGLVKFPLNETFITQEPCVPIVNCDHAEYIPINKICRTIYPNFESVREQNDLINFVCDGVFGPSVKEIWYKSIVPESGSVAIDIPTYQLGFNGLEIFSGTCNNLIAIGCFSRGQNGLIEGLNEGDSLFIRTTLQVPSVNFIPEFCIYDPCSPIISVRLGDQSEIDEFFNTYDQDIILEFNELSLSGTTSTINGRLNYFLNSPDTITISFLPANGQFVDVVVHLDELTTCPTIRENFFQAPIQYPHCINGVKDGDEEYVDCGGSCNPCTDCSGQTIYITGRIPDDSYYRLSQSITSDGYLEAHNNSKYQATESIELNSNFEVKLGAVFEAIIEDCND